MIRLYLLLLPISIYKINSGRADGLKGSGELNKLMIKFLQFFLEKRKYKHHPKHSKQEADYQARPHDGQICKLCTMWREPNKCTAVAGSISPRGWCKWYKRSKLPKGHNKEA